MGVNDSKPTGKRQRRGEAVKFRHLHFRSSSGNKLHLVERKSCPRQSKKVSTSITFLKTRNKELTNQNQFMKNEIQLLISKSLLSLI